MGTSHDHNARQPEAVPPDDRRPPSDRIGRDGPRPAAARAR